MAVSARRSILFNAAAVLVTVAAIGGVVRSWFSKPGSIPCDQRYQSLMTLSLQENGAPLTPADLQSRYGGRDVGLLENVEITRQAGAPAPVALKVNMPKGSGAPEADGVRVGGMSFPWEPRSARAQEAVCLSYGMKLSPEFETSQNGMLPGIVGRSDDGSEKFAVHLAWFTTRDHGIAHQIVTKPEAADNNGPPAPAAPAPPFEYEAKTFDIPRGQWARIAQEIILNRPGASDGILRVWVDGRLAFERTDLRLRTTPGPMISGVSAATHVLAQGAHGPAMSDSSVWFTPYELRW